MEIHQRVLSGLCGTLENVNLAMDSLVFFPSYKKISGKGICVEKCVSVRNLPST